VELDLDLAEAEIRRRWFVWTAAGLALHPVVRTAESLRVQVTRPTSSAEIVLTAGGSCEAAVQRPDAAAVLHEATTVDSIDAFAVLVDSIVELITWSGVPQEPGCTVPPADASWVLGHDGNPLLEPER
jgi:hypothetical protein